jgi:glycosyltransferase involved in cell wall biosynthesis
MKLLKDDEKSLKAVIIGGESYAIGTDQTPNITNEMIELSTTLGMREDIELTGFISNIHERIKDIPIVVLPYSEGTPNCLLEAMSLREIVVASSVGGIPKFITDGENGFLHEPNSPKDFAIAIKRVLQLEQSSIKRITENAYNTWLNDYSESVVSQRYSDFINSIINS